MRSWPQSIQTEEAFMAENPAPLDDGMSEAERAYFQTGGDVSDSLANEHRDATARQPAPEAPVAPAAPASPAAPAAAPSVQGATPPPTEEPDPGDEPAADPTKPPRRVSYRKFQAEAEARAGLERQVQEQAVKNARIEERLSLLQQALVEPAAPAAPAKEKPDPEKDIFGYARYLEEQLTAVADKVNGYEQQITAGQAEMDQERNYINSLNSYAGREPNFMHAYGYLLRNRAAELMAPRYPQATYEQLMQAEIPADVADVLRQEERDLYHTAFQEKRNPAENIFRMAQLRGFKPPTAPQAPAAPASNTTPAPNGHAQPPNPQQPVRPGTPLAAIPPVAVAPAAPNGAAPTAADLVESIKRGQNASMSLSNASGGSGIELTPQLLAEMSDEQFSALFNELQARGDKQKLMDLMGH
jgi:hypothetical protein